MSDEFKLRILPTSEQLVPLKLSTWERKIDRLTTQILLARGHDPATCLVWHLHEAVAEAKRRLGPRPRIS